MNIQAEFRGTMRDLSLSAGLFGAAAVIAVVAGIAGCHRRTSYHPPSLRHSGPFADLASIRAGNEVSITWKMPARIEDKFVRKGFGSLHVCRREMSEGVCSEVGEPILFADGTSGSFSEKLPRELDRGAPRVLIYYLEASDREGHSNLVLDEVATIAGDPPPRFQGLTAQLQKRGVLLRWPQVSDVPVSGACFLKVFRRTRSTGYNRDLRALSRTTESLGIVTLTSSAMSGMLLDKDVQPGKSYEYEAQLVTQLKTKDRTLELAGELSVPVCIYDTPRPDENIPLAGLSAAVFGEGSCRPK